MLIDRIGDGFPVEVRLCRFSCVNRRTVAMRKSNNAIWIFFSDARLGCNAVTTHVVGIDGVISSMVVPSVKTVLALK